MARNVNGRARASWLGATVLSLGLVAACAAIRSGPEARANDDPAETPMGAMQVRVGVTVRVEKVSFDRVLNGPGWLRKKYGPDWQKHVPVGFRSDKLQIARVFVSVNGGVAASSLDFRKVQPQIRISGITQYDAADWQHQLSDIDVDKAARGYLFWAVIDEDAAFDGVFPATVKLEVETGDGKKTKFVLGDLGLKSIP